MKNGNTKEVFSGHWLTFKIRTFHDKTGKERSCEFVERKNQQQVVTVICRSTHTGRYLLVKQYRIPIEAFEIAFPAGLVEEGEPIEEAALRELQEETGYSARIMSISDPLPKSAGLTSEASYIVFCETEEGRQGEPNMDDTEEITSMWIQPSEFFDLVKECNSKNIKIAHELYSYMLGWQQRNPISDS